MTRLHTALPASAVCLNVLPVNACLSVCFTARPYGWGSITDTQIRVSVRHE